MKSYDQTLNEIYTKANEQLTKTRHRRQTRRKIFISVTPVCLLLVMSLSIGVVMHFGKTPIDGLNDPVDTQKENNLGVDIGDSAVVAPPAVDDAPETNQIDSDNVSAVMPSIYPSAWKKMNAVIVKWGDQNDQTRTEIVGKYSHYNEENYSIEYVGVNVEFVTVFSETMSESLIPDIEKVIEQTSFLLIPKFYLEEIEAGETSLVFLKRFYNVANTAPDGTFLGTYTTILGASVGDCLAEDKYVPAPIFNIEDGKICVPEQAYETRPENGVYYSYIINILQEANKYVLKNDSSTSVAFKDGASVEDIAKLFSLICSSKSK